jgi:hypothetical protein
VEHSGKIPLPFAVGFTGIGIAGKGIKKVNGRKKWPFTAK